MLLGIVLVLHHDQLFVYVSSYKFQFGFVQLLDECQYCAKNVLVSMCCTNVIWHGTLVVRVHRNVLFVDVCVGPGVRYLALVVICVRWVSVGWEHVLVPVGMSWLRVLLSVLHVVPSLDLGCIPWLFTLPYRLKFALASRALNFLLFWKTRHYLVHIESISLLPFFLWDFCAINLGELRQHFDDKLSVVGFVWAGIVAQPKVF